MNNDNPYLAPVQADGNDAPRRGRPSLLLVLLRCGIAVVVHLCVAISVFKCNAPAAPQGLGPAILEAVIMIPVMEVLSIVSFAMPFQNPTVPLGILAFIICLICYCRHGTIVFVPLMGAATALQFWTAHAVIERLMSV